MPDAGLLQAFVRMHAGKFLGIRPSIRKAMTATSGRAPTGSLDPDHASTPGLISKGNLANLKLGIQIAIEDETIGALGLNSESGEHEPEVALAGVAALADAKTMVTDHDTRSAGQRAREEVELHVPTSCRMSRLGVEISRLTHYLRLRFGFEEPAAGASALYLEWSPLCRQHDIDRSEPIPDNRRPR